MAGQLYDLQAGDSITIPRNLPHRVVNAGHLSAEVLMVISPPETF